MAEVLLEWLKLSVDVASNVSSLARQNGLLNTTNKIPGNKGRFDIAGEQQNTRRNNEKQV